MKTAGNPAGPEICWLTQILPMKNLCTLLAALIGTAAICPRAAADTLEQRMRAAAGFAATQPARAGYVQVVDLKGVVQVQVQREKPWRPAEKGELLSPVARLRTGLRSSVQLLTHDGKTINVNRLMTADIAALHAVDEQSQYKPGDELDGSIRSPGAVLAWVVEEAEDGRLIHRRKWMSFDEYEQWKQRPVERRRMSQTPVQQPATQPAVQRPSRLWWWCLLLGAVLPL